LEICPLDPNADQMSNITGDNANVKNVAELGPDILV